MASTSCSFNATSTSIPTNSTSIPTSPRPASSRSRKLSGNGQGKRSSIYSTTSTSNHQSIPPSTPKYRFLLPLISLLDLSISIAVSYLIITHLKQKSTPIAPSNPSPISNLFSYFSSTPNPPQVSPSIGSFSHDPCLSIKSYFVNPSSLFLALRDQAPQLIKLTYSILACCIARCSTLLVVGISKKIRNLGIVVAAVCMLSTLFNISIANLLFQGKGLNLNIFGSSTSTSSMPISKLLHKPTIPFFICLQLLFILLEWLIYVSIISERNARGARVGMQALSSSGVRKRTISGVSNRSKGKGKGKDDEISKRSSLVASPTSTSFKDSAAGEEEGVVGSETVGDQERVAEEEEMLIEEEDETSDDDEDEETPDEEEEELLAEREESNLELGQESDERTRLIQSTSNGNQVASSSFNNNFDLDSSRNPVPSSGSNPIVSPPQTTVSSTEEGSSEADSETEGAQDTLDPDDIVDINPDKRLSRKESRRRLRRSMMGKFKSRLGFKGNSVEEASEAEASPRASSSGARNSSSGYGTFKK